MTRLISPSRRTKTNSQNQINMKNTRLIMVLAALTVSARIAAAQNEDLVGGLIPVPPPPEGLADGPGGTLDSEPRLRLAASEDQLRQAELALETRQKTMKLAQERAADVGRTLTLNRRLAGVVHRSGNRTLVIPKSAGDARSFGEVEEDMNVMAHILDKAASRDDKSARAMGIRVFDRISDASPQNLYLEGYGAVFLENVNYPLRPPPAMEDEGKAKDNTSTEWDQARREMSQPATASVGDPFAAALETYGEFVWNGGGASPYDADKVAELQNDLIAALKNTANIRKLKSDETVTVVVTGASPGGTGKGIKRSASKSGRNREEEVVIAEITAGDRAPAPTPAKLILRVRKADAEAFQAGKLSLDEFRKKVTTMLN